MAKDKTEPKKLPTSGEVEVSRAEALRLSKEQSAAMYERDGKIYVTKDPKMFAKNKANLINAAGKKVQGWVDQEGNVVKPGDKTNSMMRPVFGKPPANKEEGARFYGTQVIAQAAALRDVNPNDYEKGTFMTLTKESKYRDDKRLQKVRDLEDGSAIYVKVDKVGGGIIGTAGDVLNIKNLEKKIPGWAYDAANIVSAGRLSPGMLGGRAGAERSSKGVSGAMNIVGQAADTAAYFVNPVAGAAATAARKLGNAYAQEEVTGKDANWGRVAGEIGLDVAINTFVPQGSTVASRAGYGAVRGGLSSAGQQLINGENIDWGQVGTSAGTSAATSAAMGYLNSRAKTPEQFDTRMDPETGDILYDPGRTTPGVGSTEFKPSFETTLPDYEVLPNQIVQGPNTDFPSAVRGGAAPTPAAPAAAGVPGRLISDPTAIPASLSGISVPDYAASVPASGSTGAAPLNDTDAVLVEYLKGQAARDAQALELIKANNPANQTWMQKYGLPVALVGIPTISNIVLGLQQEKAAQRVADQATRDQEALFNRQQSEERELSEQYFSEMQEVAAAPDWGVVGQPIWGA